MHLRPVQRAVAGRRDDRILPPEIAPLAGLRAAEPLLHRRDVIRHAAAVPGIVLPCDRLPGSHGPVDDTRAIHEDVGDVHDGDVARPPVAGAEEKSRAHDDAGTPEESRRVSRMRVVPGPGCPVDGRIRRPPPRSVRRARIVVRHVNDLRRGRLDGDGVALLDHVRLLSRSQIARVIRLLPQALNRFHHLRLLGDENIAEP